MDESFFNKLIRLYGLLKTRAKPRHNKPASFSNPLSTSIFALTAARFLNLDRTIAGRSNTTATTFSNPEKDLDFTLHLSPRTRMVFLTISLESLHHLFIHEPLPFLKPENAMRKFYDEREIPSFLLVELTQLFKVHLSDNASRLFYQGKILEFLALYFSNKTADTESCPFLNDEGTVRKLKQAREYILKHIEKPPTLGELAKLVGLNGYQLKAGFKEIYGNTVYGYLLDHKLNNARVLLDSRKYQVTQVAYQIGYTNPSHFITAFKKKFGVTPKKYLMNKS